MKQKNKENQHISRIFRITAYQPPFAPYSALPDKKNRMLFRDVVGVIPLYVNLVRILWCGYEFREDRSLGDWIG